MSIRLIQRLNLITAQLHEIQAVTAKISIICGRLYNYECICIWAVEVWKNRSFDKFLNEYFVLH